MPSELHTLLQTLFEDDPAPAPACAACRQALPGYVDAQLAGHETAHSFPAVRAHLMECPLCREVYTELHALLAAEAADTLASPPLAPTFNFAYLNTPLAASRPWRWDSLGRLVIRFSSELLAALSSPAARPAYAYLKSSAAGGRQIEAGSAADDLHVQVHVEPQRRDPALVTLELDVDVPSRGGWPHLDGIRVVLRRGEVLLAEQLTDPFGKVVFEDIPAATLSELVIEVEK